MKTNNIFLPQRAGTVRRAAEFLHLLIIFATLLLAISCHTRLQDSSAVTTPQNGAGVTLDGAGVGVHHLAGMTYVVIAGQVINLTKDSLEVALRRRNNQYLDLANKQHQK